MYTECFTLYFFLLCYSSLQADSKVKFEARPTSWRPPGADRLWPRWTTVNSRIWLASKMTAL